MPVQDDSEDDTDFEAVAVALDEGRGILGQLETSLDALDSIIDEGDGLEFEDDE